MIVGIPKLESFNDSMLNRNRSEYLYLFLSRSEADIMKSHRIYFRQNAGMNKDSIVNSSRRPVSIRKERYHLAVSER